jgi:transient receptor potential cation channel subfamily C member 4
LIGCRHFAHFAPGRIQKLSIIFSDRGDVSTARSIIKAMGKRPQIFDMNCVDPLGRSALIIAVENENRDMIEMLLEMGIKIKDALLVAIR